jgi:hypothetical protein
VLPHTTTTITLVVDLGLSSKHHIIDTIAQVIQSVLSNGGDYHLSQLFQKLEDNTISR